MWSLYVIFVAIDARPASPTLLDNTGHPAPDHQTQVNTLSLLFPFVLIYRTYEKKAKKIYNIFICLFVKINAKANLKKRVKNTPNVTTTVHLIPQKLKTKT